MGGRGRTHTQKQNKQKTTKKKKANKTPQKPQQKQIKPSSSFVFLKSSCQDITAIYCILNQTIFNSLEEENLAPYQHESGIVYYFERKSTNSMN